MKRIIGKSMFAALVALTGIATSAAQANEGRKTLVLDLAEAIKIALSENPTVKTADMEILRYDYVRREAVGNHLPTLSAGGQLGYNIIKSEMAEGMSFDPDLMIAASVDLSVPLFVPAVYSSLKMTRTQQALAVEQARSSRIDLVNAVKKGFYQILLLEKSYNVLHESRSTIQATVNNTRTMYEAGLASEYDLLTAEVQLSNLAPNIIATENGVGVAKQMLRMYLSIPENVDLQLIGSLDNFRENVFSMPNPNTDLDGNSQMRQLDMQQSLLRQQIKLTNTGYMPSIIAYGAFSVSGMDKTSSFMGGSEPDPNATTPDPNMPVTVGMLEQMMGGGGVTQTDKWRWQTPFSAGLRVSIPIFTGLKEHNKVKQLRNQVAQIDLQKDYLREAKLLEARTAINALFTARETMLANEKTVAQAEKAYGIARTRFDAGAGTMLEVNQAQLAVTQSRLNHSQAIYDFLAAQADYNKVIGLDN